MSFDLYALLREVRDKGEADADSRPAREAIIAEVDRLNARIARLEQALATPCYCCRTSGCQAGCRCENPISEPPEAGLQPPA